jgi:pimeloyl-ACP methyl ester carboxylesterase
MTNRIMLRSRVPGMVVASRAEVGGSPRELRRPRLTLLVHGYRTDEDRAEKGYVAFERRLREAGISNAALGSVWHVHWPADHRRPLVARLSYSARVPVAETAGRRLKDLLATLSTAQEVRLVGHSLGCRLVLETIRYVREDVGYDGARIAAVVLLAAAVPQLFCTHEPYPFPAPGPADASEQHVWHSTSVSASTANLATPWAAVGDRTVAGTQAGTPACVMAPTGARGQWRSK